jgi:drug/metabolite transporter (DMT)-like permease
METINFLLRTSSVIVTGLILFQFFSRKGSRLHTILGTITILLGVFIVGFVTIRGMHNKEQLSALYAAHLFFGTSFFLCLFATGFYGYKTLKDPKLKHRHALCAKMTLAALLITLVFGIVSFSIHSPHKKQSAPLKEALSFFIDEHL